MQWAWSSLRSSTNGSTGCSRLYVNSHHGFSKPTLAQLLRADRQAFVRLQEQSREGIKPHAAGTRPLNDLIKNLTSDHTVTFRKFEPTHHPWPVCKCLRFSIATGKSLFCNKLPIAPCTFTMRPQTSAKCAFRLTFYNHFWQVQFLYGKWSLTAPMS